MAGRPGLIARYVRRFRAENIALVEAVLIGLAAGTCAFLLAGGVSWLGTWRVHLAELGQPEIVLPAIGLFGGLISGWMVEAVAPEASGSGIPQVKAMLARLPVKLDLRVALVKLAGGVLSLGTGMPLG